MLRLPSHMLASHSPTNPPPPTGSSRHEATKLYLCWSLPGTGQSHQSSSGIFFLLMWDVSAGVSRVLQPRAQQSFDSIETVSRLLGQAQRLAVTKAVQQHLSSYVTERGVRSALGLNKGEDQQEPHPRREGSLLGLLQQALAFEQSQCFLITRTFSFMLFLQGQLALGIPQSS